MNGWVRALALAAAVATVPGCALVRALGGDDEPAASGGDAGEDAGGADGDPSGDAAPCAQVFADTFGGTELDDAEWFHEGPDPTVAGGDLTISLDGDTDGDVTTTVFRDAFYLVDRHRATLELTVTVEGDAELLVSWDQDQGESWFGLRANEAELAAYDSGESLCADDCPILVDGVQHWLLRPAGGDVELSVDSGGGAELVGAAPAVAGNFRLEILADVDGPGDSVVAGIHAVTISDCDG